MLLFFSIEDVEKGTPPLQLPILPPGIHQVAIFLLMFSKCPYSVTALSQEL